MLETLLTVVFVVIAIALVLVINGIFLEWYYSAPTRHDETHFFRTVDGWRLAIHRYRPKGDQRGLPVILCHGLGGNRYSFELRGAPSLASFLRDRGRDVWIVELRGSGLSDRPGLLTSDVPYAWGFDDHLERDVPAAIGCVLDRTGAPAVHWVGHSMGGMLAQAHLARGGDPSPASVVTLGSPADFSKIPLRIFKILLKARCLLKGLHYVPLPFLVRLSIPVVHRLPAYVQGLFYPPNIEPFVARRIVAVGSPLVWPSKLWLDFARFLNGGVLAPDNGGPYLETLRESPVPLLTICGSQDLLAPPEAAYKPSPQRGDAGERMSVIVGRGFGCVEDYGHIDLLLGSRADKEVYPLVLSWLQDHDTPVGNTHVTTQSGSGDVDPELVTSTHPRPESSLAEK